jgi:hypothetical protein
MIGIIIVTVSVIISLILFFRKCNQIEAKMNAKEMEDLKKLPLDLQIR